MFEFAYVCVDWFGSDRVIAISMKIYNFKCQFCCLSSIVLYFSSIECNKIGIDNNSKNWLFTVELMIRAWRKKKKSTELWFESFATFWPRRIEFFGFKINKISEKIDPNVLCGCMFCCCFCSDAGGQFERYARNTNRW